MAPMFSCWLKSWLPLILQFGDWGFWTHPLPGEVEEHNPSVKARIVSSLAKKLQIQMQIHVQTKIKIQIPFQLGLTQDTQWLLFCTCIGFQKNMCDWKMEMYWNMYDKIYKMSRQTYLRVGSGAAPRRADVEKKWNCSYSSSILDLLEKRYSAKPG